MDWVHLNIRRRGAPLTRKIWASVQNKQHLHLYVERWLAYSHFGRLLK